MIQVILKIDLQVRKAWVYVEQDAATKCELELGDAAQRVLLGLLNEESEKVRMEGLRVKEDAWKNIGGGDRRLESISKALDEIMRG